MTKGAHPLAPFVILLHHRGNQGNMLTIGIDFGGTSIKIGLIDNEQLIHVRQIPADSDGTLKNKLPEIEECVETIMAEHAAGMTPRAIGMAFPSIVDSISMRITTEYVKFSDAIRLDLPSWAKSRWGIPLVLENDARAALVGEWKFGAGQGYSDIVMVTIGTGFGSAVLTEGRLLKGAHFVAGNLGGHMIINHRGSKCNCGAIGCVESESSSWVLESRYRDSPLMASSSLADIDQLNFRDVFLHADNGDEFALRIRDDSISAWAATVFNLVHAFDPSVVIVGGGVMHRADIIIPALREYVDRYTWPVAGTYRFLTAEQPEYAGVLGMAYLASMAS